MSYYNTHFPKGLTQEEMEFFEKLYEIEEFPLYSKNCTDYMDKALRNWLNRHVPLTDKEFELIKKRRIKDLREAFKELIKEAMGDKEEIVAIKEQLKKEINFINTEYSKTEESLNLYVILKYEQDYEDTEEDPMQYLYDTYEECFGAENARDEYLSRDFLGLWED